MEWLDASWRWVKDNLALVIIVLLISVALALALRSSSSVEVVQQRTVQRTSAPAPSDDLDDIQSQLDAVFEVKTRQRDEARRRMTALYKQNIDAKKAHITKLSNELKSLEDNYKEAQEKMK